MTRSSIPVPPITSTARISASDIQQQLGGLNPSDNTYLQLLQELLTHRDLRKHILGLHEDNLRGFIELLDNALDQIPDTDDLFRKTLRRLQSTCGNREVLPSSYHIPSERISNRGEPFAAGGFADVHEAELDGQKVCIKALRCYSQDTLGFVNKIFYREVVVWKRLHHPNIVPFLGVPAKLPPFEIVCDWMKNGRINDYLRNHPQEDRISLLWDVAEGLHYLHSCKIIHGDLKPANILVDESGRARLTDFGLIHITQGDNSIRSPQDPAMANATWAAPEILKGGAATKEGDIFTFAMVAVETFTGHAPFAMNYQTGLYEIMDGKRPKRPENLNHDGLWSLIRRCWDQDPGMRPNTSEILESFKALFPGKREIQKSRALPSTLSTWTLVDPEDDLDRDARPRPDPSRQDTQEADDPGPHDLPAGSQPQPGPEPQPPIATHNVTTPGEPKPADVGGPKQQNAPPPSRQPMSKFRKFIKSASSPPYFKFKKEAADTQSKS